MSTRSAPDRAVLVDLITQDALLGYETVRARIQHVTPQRPEQVEPACLACFGRERWSSFRDVTARWLSDASPQVARPLRVLCVELSERELLLTPGSNA